MSLARSALALACFSATLAFAQTKTLNAVYTPASIQADGRRDAAWDRAAPAAIAICMNPKHTAQLDHCQVSGEVRALWNGSLLYLLFTVTDPDIATASTVETARSGVQVYVDQLDDKFPKFEEDDGYMRTTPPSGPPICKPTPRPFAPMPEARASVIPSRSPGPLAICPSATAPNSAWNSSSTPLPALIPIDTSSIGAAATIRV
jgi:hypothetical protein